MDPIAALLEIAELLERERASRYRAKAFRAAASAIQGIAAPQLSTRLRVGKIPGVGDTTRAVILEALGGDVPAYLAELRARYGLEQSALRSLLRGDLHCHSDWSDGTTPIGDMVAAARALGHDYLALTDHSPRLRVAHGLSAQRLRAQLAEVPVHSAPGFTLLSGIEVDIRSDGQLDQTDELLDVLDVVVASAHSQLRMPAEQMTPRLVRAVSSGCVDVLGHVTGRLVAGERGTRPPSAFDPRRVFDACARHEVAVEINSRPERDDPPDELILLALEAGCLFSIDSDAHAPGQLSLLDHGAARAERLGVPADRIVTTWPLQRLRAWLSRPAQSRSA